MFFFLYRRLISLKGSDFDTKKSLLDAVRREFPGSVSFAPGVKNEHISAFWHWLVGQYDPTEGIKLYGTSHFGCHPHNYWVLSEEVIQVIIFCSCQSSSFKFKFQVFVSFAPGVKNEHISAFWHWLVGQYDPTEGIKLYGTSHFGCHPDNYWVLSEEVIQVIIFCSCQSSILFYTVYQQKYIADGNGQPALFL